MASASTPALPLISIGIPAYNCADKIAQTIQSIGIQAYPQLELIISDDASKDETEAVCRELAQTDPRIRYFRQQQNLGISGNFEYCLQQASGKYFMWVSHDDQLRTGVLNQYVSFLEQHAQYALVIGEIYYWENGAVREIEKGLSLEQDKGLSRSLHYYRKVKQGAIFYGLQRTNWAKRIRFRQIIGGDWHYVAALAYLGKVKQLALPGYDKYPGGVSSTFVRYAKAMGEKRIWGKWPYVKIGIDAFREIAFLGKVYQAISPPIRFMAAILAMSLVILRYYLGIYPRILAGKLLRLLGLRTPRERNLEKSLSTEERI